MKCEKFIMEYIHIITMELVSNTSECDLHHTHLIKATDAHLIEVPVRANYRGVGRVTKGRG